MKHKEIVPTFHNWVLYKKSRISKNTLPNYWAVQKNLHEFLSQTNYRFIHELRIPFMKQFNDYLYKRFGASHIKRNLNTVQAFVKWCVNMELLEYSNVRDYEIETPFERKHPVSLSANEVSLLEEAILSERLDRVRKLFLMQCYTGLSYRDIPGIIDEKIKIVKIGGLNYLIGERVKTGIEFNVPLTEKSLLIIDKVKSTSAIYITNQKYNLYLKEIGKQVGIKKKLTTHVGRRTCGQIYLDMGFSIEAVSRMLGHTDIKTTQQHYARTSFERVHKENLRIAI